MSTSPLTGGGCATGASTATRFDAAYRTMIGRVRDAGLIPVVMGLPLMELADDPNGEHRSRSRLLEQIAEDGSHPFVDSAAAMAGAAPCAAVPYRWSCTPLSRVVDAITMQVAPVTKDACARHRRLTVDGVHWSSTAATAIAAAPREESGKR